MWGLVPWVGIETGPPISGMWSLSPWATREVLPHLLLYWIKHLPVSVATLSSKYQLDTLIFPSSQVWLLPSAFSGHAFQ